MVRAEAQRFSQIKANLKRRALVQDSIRAFFRNEDFLEVDTPLRVPTVAPEPHIAPFRSDGWFLSTSPEMHMKRLLAGGYGNMFQICHCFRKGERGQLHNPEFTMLEWYRLDADYMQIVQDAQRLILYIADSLGLGSTIHYQGSELNVTPPWSTVSVSRAFLDSAGWDPVYHPDTERFDIDLVDRVMPSFALDRPSVLVDYPAASASMARLKAADPRVAERAEVFIGGLELANAYSELTDTVELEQRFRTEVERLKSEEGQNIALPRKFLEATTDLPTSGGIALGLDRLVMLFCDAASIDEVIAFPHDLA